MSKVVRLNIDSNADGTTGIIGVGGTVGTEGGWKTIGAINIGAADGMFDGQIIKVGIPVTLPIVENNPYYPVTWDATGTRIIMKAFR